MTTIPRLPSVREITLEDVMLRERRLADILEDENEDPTHAVIARIKAHRVRALEIEAQLREVRGCS